MNNVYSKIKSEIYIIHYLKELQNPLEQSIPNNCDLLFRSMCQCDF